MRPRTPGFEPRRLHEARLARGLTRIALARLVARSVSSVSKWESGEQTPEPESLVALAQALDTPQEHFLRPAPPAGEGPRFFRSMASTTERARERIACRLHWLEGLSLDLQEWVELPPLDLPPRLARDFRSLSPEDLEEAAFVCRRHWQLGCRPIQDMLLVLENAGIVVGSDTFDAPSIDGVSHWSAADRRPYVLLSRDKRSAVRSRFDAAHELAHLVLHAGIDPAGLRDPETFKDLERQAHRFAGAFLLPGEGFAAELAEPSLDGLAALKPRWGASIAAMIHRCRDLGIITEGHAGQLFKYASARGWRRREPYDDTIALERPRLMERSVRLVLSDGGLTPAVLLARLRLWARDIEDLTGLAPGILGSPPERVAVLPTPRFKTPRPGAAGTLVPFPGPLRK